jgi:2-iminobutanoate/2-iminopropanoate deaminase
MLATACEPARRVGIDLGRMSGPVFSPCGSRETAARPRRDAVLRILRAMPTPDDPKSESPFLRARSGALVEYRRSAATAAMGLPFSDAVRVGDQLFTSGQLGNVPGKLELVPGGIGPESRQAMENLRAVLEANGASLDRVVKCTVFLADIAEWPAFNKVYTGYFATNLPARSALAASGLALGARVELEAIAVLTEGF